MDAGARAGPSDPAHWASTPPDGDNAASLHAFLEFLSDGLLPDHPPLDPSNLASVSTAPNAVDQQQQPAKRLKDELSPHVPEELCGAGANDLDNSEDEEEDEQPTKRGKRKASSAATSKANREKARREKINEKFAELAKLVEPGKEPKTDKLSILTEAIRFVNSMRLEKEQYQQFNKFLQEKVAAQEKERVCLMMQQQYPQQPAVPPGMMLVPVGGGGMGQQYMMGQSPMPPMQHPMQHIQGVQQQHPQPMGLMPLPQQHSLPQGYMPQQPMASMPQQPHMQPHMQPQQPQMQQHEPSGAAADAPSPAAQYPQLSHPHSLQQRPAAHASAAQPAVLPNAAAPQPGESPMGAPQQPGLQRMGSADTSAASAAPAPAAAPGAAPLAQLPHMYMAPLAGKPGAAMMAMAGGMPGGMMYVDPSMLDSTKDSQLRPPAA